MSTSSISGAVSVASPLPTAVTAASPVSQPNSTDSLRKQLHEAASKALSALNSDQKKNADPKAFFATREFVRYYDSGAIVRKEYILKSGKNPSEAIEALIENGTSLEIDKTQIACYAALCDVLTKAKFDAFFKADSKTPLSFSRVNVLNPLTLLDSRCLEILVNKESDVNEIGSNFDVARVEMLMKSGEDALALWLLEAKRALESYESREAGDEITLK